MCDLLSRQEISTVHCTSLKRRQTPCLEETRIACVLFQVSQTFHNLTSTCGFLIVWCFLLLLLMAASEISRKYSLSIQHRRACDGMYVSRELHLCVGISLVIMSDVLS